MTENQKVSDPVRLAIVGLGRAGWNIHANRIRGHAEFRIVDVADVDAERRTEAKGDFACRTHADYRSLLAATDAEVVVVATQSSTHAEIACAVLDAGHDVIVEKPMALNVPDAQRMAEAAKRNGRRLFVHQNYRYYPDSRHVVEIARTGAHIGTLFEVRVRALSFFRRNDWQTLRKFGGGELNNSCPHFIDMALLLLDAPVKDVFGDLKLISNSGDAEDHVKLLIRGTNGRLIDLEISSSCAFPEPKWTLLGSNGTLVSDGKTSKVKRFDPAKIKPLPVVESAPAGRKYGNDDVLPWEEYEIPSVGSQTSDFYDNVHAVLRSGAAQEVTPDHVINLMRVIDRAREGSGF